MTLKKRLKAIKKYNKHNYKIERSMLKEKNKLFESINKEDDSPKYRIVDTGGNYYA